MTHLMIECMTCLILYLSMAYWMLCLRMTYLMLCLSITYLVHYCCITYQMFYLIAASLMFCLCKSYRISLIDFCMTHKVTCLYMTYLMLYSCVTYQKFFLMWDTSSDICLNSAILSTMNNYFGLMLAESKLKLLLKKWISRHREKGLITFNKQKEKIGKCIGI